MTERFKRSTTNRSSGSSARSGHRIGVKGGALDGRQFAPEKDEGRERSPVASRRLLSCVLPALSLTAASGHIAVVSRRRSARAYPRKVVHGEPRAGLLRGAHTSGNVPAELGTA